MNRPQRGDLLKRYRVRIKSAQDHREKAGYDRLWKRLVDLYKGKHFPKSMSSEDRIAVNIAFSTINVIAPSISVNHPKISVWAQKAEDNSKGVILETVVNYWWRHYKIKPTVSLAVKDYLIIGHAWVKCGYRYVEEAKEEAEEASYGTTDADDSVTPAAEDDHSYINEVPQISGDIEPQTDTDPANDVDTKFTVVEDRPFVERVSPHDVYIDPEAVTLDEAKWIAQKIVKPLEEVRNDKRYRAAARKSVKPDSQATPNWEGDASKIHDDVKRVTIWEFYDLKQGTMCVFPQIGDDLLIDPIPQPYLFGHPFVMLRNYDVPDEFYPMGDLEAIEPLQMELDKTRSQLMNHRKKYARKFLYYQSAFGEKGAAELASDRDNVMVPVVNEKIPLSEAVVPLKQEAINPELYNYVEQIEGDLDRVSGVSEYERGALPEIRRTATEASIIQDAANARVADKLAQIEGFIGIVASRLVQLAQQYMTEEQTVRILGTNGHPLWVPFKPEDIQGEYDFEVEGGSTQPKNDTMRRQQAMQMLQTFANFAETGVVNMPALIKYALQFGFDIKNPEQFIQAPPPQSSEPTPQERLIETMNYKDAPPDIQRQMEQVAGFQPSQVGGSSPAEQAVGDQMGATAQQLHDLGKQGGDHGHQLGLQAHKQSHDQQMAAAQAQQAMAQAQMQHEQSMQGNAQQAVLGAITQPAAGGDQEGQGQNAGTAPPDPKLMQLLAQLHSQVGLPVPTGH